MWHGIVLGSIKTFQSILHNLWVNTFSLILYFIVHKPCQSGKVTKTKRWPPTPTTLYQNRQVLELSIKIKSTVPLPRRTPPLTDYGLTTRAAALKWTGAISPCSALHIYSFSAQSIRCQFTLFCITCFVHFRLNQSGTSPLCSALHISFIFSSTNRLPVQPVLHYIFFYLQTVLPLVHTLKMVGSSPMLTAILLVPIPCITIGCFLIVDAWRRIDRCLTKGPSISYQLSGIRIFTKKH